MADAVDVDDDPRNVSTGSAWDVGDTRTPIQAGIRYVTGVGSRSTPPEALAVLGRIFDRLARAGIVLRTGGAYGADNACLFGAIGSNIVDGLHDWPRTLQLPTEFDVRAVVYLPWVDDAPHGLVAHLRDHPRVRFRRVEGDHYANDILFRHHPAALRLTRPARALHLRNIHAVLGDHQMPLASELVICWTQDGAGTDGIQTGRETGGTGMAIRVADAFNIPVINLARVFEKANDWELVEHMTVGIALALRDRKHLGHIYPTGKNAPEGAQRRR